MAFTSRYLPTYKLEDSDSRIGRHLQSKVILAPQYTTSLLFFNIITVTEPLKIEVGPNCILCHTKVNSVYWTWLNELESNNK